MAVPRGLGSVAMCKTTNFCYVKFTAVEKTVNVSLIEDFVKFRAYAFLHPDMKIEKKKKLLFFVCV